MTSNEIFNPYSALLITLGFIVGICGLVIVIHCISKQCIKNEITKVMEETESLCLSDFDFVTETRKGECYLPKTRTTDRTDIVEEKERICSYSLEEGAKRVVVEIEIPVYTAITDNDEPYIPMQERLAGYKRKRIPLSLWENFKKEMESCTKVETEAYVIKAKIGNTKLLSLVEKNSHLIDTSEFAGVFLDERYNIPLLMTGNAPYSDEKDKAELVSKIKKRLLGHCRRILDFHGINV